MSGIKLDMDTSQNETDCDLTKETANEIKIEHDVVNNEQNSNALVLEEDKVAALPTTEGKVAALLTSEGNEGNSSMEICSEETAENKVDFEAIKAGTAATSVTVVENASEGDNLCNVVDPKTLGDRDILIDHIYDKGEPKANLLLQDLIKLEHILFVLQHGVNPSKEEEIKPFTNRVFDLVKNGTPYRLYGHEIVPYPFMKSSGKFVVNDRRNGCMKVLSDEEAKRSLMNAALENFSKGEVGSLEGSPFTDLKVMLEEWKKKCEAYPVVTLIPGDNDVILFRSAEVVDDEVVQHHVGNKTFFNLASELVSTSTKSSEERIIAALKIMEELEKAMKNNSSSDGSYSSVCPRFLIRGHGPENSISWEILSPTAIAEFCVVYVFEVYLEKVEDTGKIVTRSKRERGVNATGKFTVPVSEPTENDVLFGRGGLTNTHTGNRRFRDIIALHRPDYVRAVKMDKPVVAKRIVQAFRRGYPPGRFLKKHTDGLWYDVGDRAAAEKTSQGLRERTNVEKRHRSALREAMRTVQHDGAEVSESDSDRPKYLTYPPGVVAKKITVTSIPRTTNQPRSENVYEKNAKSASNSKISHRQDNTASASSPMENLPPNAVDTYGNILVTDYDILCGRGGLTNHHKGNKRFRDIVALHRSDYVRAPKIQKPSVAKVIVRAIRNGDPPGRFLRRNEKTGQYYDVGDKKAAEKTSQALREKSDEEREISRAESAGTVPFMATFDASQLLVNVSAMIPSKSADFEKRHEVAATTHPDPANTKTIETILAMVPPSILQQHSANTTSSVSAESTQVIDSSPVQEKSDKQVAGHESIDANSNKNSIEVSAATKEVVAGAPPKPMLSEV